MVIRRDSVRSIQVQVKGRAHGGNVIGIWNGQYVNQRNRRSNVTFEPYKRPERRHPGAGGAPRRHRRQQYNSINAQNAAHRRAR